MKLTDYLKRHRPKRKFKTGAILLGSEVDVIWENVPYYAEYLNSKISLYRAWDGDRVIGVRASVINKDAL